MQEMLAILGATYEETRGVLQALGYQAETITKPEDKSPTDDAEPVETDSQAADSAPTAETTPDTIVRESTPPETPAEDNTATDGAQQTAPTQTDPHSGKTKSKKTRTLNVYSKKIVHEDGTSEIVENNEFWFMPSRRQQSRGQGNRAHGKSNAYRKSKKTSKQGRTPPASRHHKAKEERRMEDSPFAALAALKTPKGGD